QGSRFGPTGNFENWWTPADAKGFSSRTDKLVKQFDSYEALPGLHVNGKLTLGENIADLGGLATAYDAMKIATEGTPDPMTDGMTREQRFFLNFGTSWRTQMTPDVTKVAVASDPHAPANFRAVGAPANLAAFATAFSCKPGDAMSREGEERVVIELVLLDLAAEQAAGEGRGVDRHAREVGQHVRQPADVVLV
ncbi:MAG: M13-type metalloendopeptidase, partial [Rhodanobacter sp.]